MPFINHNGYYLKVLHPAFFLLTQFRKFVGLLPTLYKYRRDVEIKHYNIAKTVGYLSKRTFFAFQNQHLTTTKPCWLVGLSVLDKAMMWLSTSRKQVTHFFSCNRSVDSSAWTGFIPVFDYDLQTFVNAYCIPMIMHQILPPSF